MMRRIFGWLGGLSALGLSVVLVGSGTAVVGGGVMAYRTYDFVQHDNDFCLSCHLMVEPYELFAESAHRDLGCKACHQPTLVERSTMGMAQFIDNPDSIRVHAHVPNETCATCHIEGDPEKWESIANSAGHRVHLESEDPDLAGLMCVECHSSSLHQFAATDETCAQSGCHTDIEVKLGRMGDFTIHCAACHGFSAPIADTATVETALAALAPTNNECLSCHVMRTIVEMPPDEPHGQVCSTCHNPHEQTTPAQAVETCATSACHSDPTELTAMHRGLDHPVVENCSTCHGAHTWEADANDCLSCHTDIFETDAAPPTAAGQVALRPAGTRSAVPDPHPPVGIPVAVEGLATRVATRGNGPPLITDPTRPLPTAALRHAARSQEAPSRPRQEARPPITGGDPVFRHGDHRDVECTSCHVSDEEHGRITVTEVTDCRSCHHEAPVANDCAACHAPAALADRDLTAAWPMRFSWGATRAASVEFAHETHPDAECSTCHVEGLVQPVDVQSCNGCHQDHHAVGATCVTCHAAPVDRAHDVESHLTCAGSGCHVSAPFQGVPRDRNACLSCHQDLQDHRPEGDCIECHTLPPPRGGAMP